MHLLEQKIIYEPVLFPGKHSIMSSSSLLFPKQNLSDTLNCSDTSFLLGPLEQQTERKICTITSYRSFQVLSYILFLLVETACYKFWSPMLCFQFTTKNIGHFMQIPLHFLGYCDNHLTLKSYVLFFSCTGF